MAAILIDYENVNGTEAFRGVNELMEQDILNIFYSDPCKHIKQYEMDAIAESGCRFFITKLVHPRANALDFYIAAECGKLSGQGVRNIVIVSKDKGFASVVDYFKRYGEIVCVSLPRRAWRLVLQVSMTKIWCVRIFLLKKIRY